MLVLFSYGEYSDYGIESLYEGKREDFQNALKEWRTRSKNWDHGDIEALFTKMMGIYDCKKVEYEEVNKHYDDSITNFCDMEKKPFMVRIAYQKDLTVDAFSEEEAKVIVKKPSDGMTARIIHVKELGT